MDYRVEFQAVDGGGWESRDFERFPDAVQARAELAETCYDVSHVHAIGIRPLCLIHFGADYRGISS